MVQRGAGSKFKGHPFADEETEAQLVLWFGHAMVRAWFHLGVLWKSEEAGPH